MLERLLAPWQRLSWRLTFSYTIVTVATLLVVELAILAVMGIVVFAVAGNIVLPQAIVQIGAGQFSPSLQPYLHQSPADAAAVQAWLDTEVEQDTTTAQGAGPQISLSDLADGLSIVIDRDGRVLAARPSGVALAGQKLDPSLRPGIASLAAAALSGDADPDHLVVREPSGLTLLAIPISDSKRTLGALILEVDAPARPLLLSIVQAGVQVLLGSALIFTVAAGLLGTVFGLLTARGLTRRLSRLSHAAASWSQGDFSVSVHDGSGDELGQLARNLNSMAEQVQNLLETRQQLAALEERNRLARDLHDSVKQQIFAVTMQLGAARTLLEQDSAGAARRLDEAEHLARQAQHELAGLIRELRPAALEGRSLGAALGEYLADWSRHTDIRSNLRLQGERALPLDVEQAFFRTAQEALANVARHSDASDVDVLLQWQDASFCMTVSDNGRGFDLATKEGRGVGLSSMRERVEKLGGTMDMNSETGKGTTVRFSVQQPPLESGEKNV